MNIFKSTVFSILCALISIGAEAQWEEVAPFNFPGRHHPVTFSIDGYGYLMTGTASNGLRVRDMHRYDPVADRWEEIESFPGEARSFSYAVVEDKKAYIGFGFSAGGFLLNDLWSFDPSTGDWERLADCPCPARTHPAFLALNGKLYVAAGGASANLNDFWEYDIATDTWRELPDFPSTTRHHPYHFTLHDKVYVGLGHGSQTINGEIIYRDFYAFDPTEEAWERIADIPGQGRVAGTQFSHNNKGYVLSGDGEDHWTIETGEFWQYDPDTDSWEQLPPHPGNSLWAPGSFVIDDTAYFMGGYHNNFASYPTDVWAFDLSTLSTSTEDVATESDLQVFPNPANDVITVSMQNMGTGSSDLTITNINGQVIHHIEQYDFSPIPLDQMPAGTYILSLTHQKLRHHTTFIKL